MLATDPVSLVIPSEIIQSIGKGELELRIELAIFFYKKFNLSSGEAAKFAEIPRIAFLHELGKRKLPVNYNEDDARHDVETMQRLSDKFPVKQK